MPFTLSHAAAALPFRRLKPVWPALVIGTFAPDIQYFIWISDEDRSGHHFPQILFLTLPLALLVLWLFEKLVKRPAVELLSEGVQRRLQDKLAPLAFTGWKQFGSVVLWIAIGILTHIVWDQFTHPRTRMVELFPVLATWISVPLLHSMQISKLLQHISTVLGIVVLAIWFAAWYRRTTPVPHSRIQAFPVSLRSALIAGMSLAALLIGYPLAIWRLEDHEGPIKTIFLVVTVFEAVTLIFCIALLVYGAALTLNARLRHLPAAQLDESGG